MPRMTPEQEAAYALDYGVSRDDLPPEAQAAYDQLVKDYPAGRPLEEVPSPPARSAPEVRARILQMFKRANPKYARPFEDERLSGYSIVGTDSWAEYGQVVLQMAILDTLLSIEELLSQRQDSSQGDEDGNPPA